MISPCFLNGFNDFLILFENNFDFPGFPSPRGGNWECLERWTERKTQNCRGPPTRRRILASVLFN